MTTAQVQRRRAPYVFAALLVLLGSGFLYGGIKLLVLGGSWYYAIAGLAIFVSAGLLFTRNPLGSRVFGLLIAATLAWGVYEVGPDLWALAGRLGLLTVFGLWFLTPFVRRPLYSPAAPPPLFGTIASKTATAAIVVAMLGIAVAAARGGSSGLPMNPSANPSSAKDAAGDWPHYGNTTHGTRFARIDQITPANAGSLQEIWHYRTGRPGQFKATPLQIGELLYFCTAMNVVVALDAESGEKRWEMMNV